MNNASNADEVVIVLITAPDDAVAARVADVLVQGGLCACVTILPAVRSVYRWQGVIERASEVQLIAKSRRGRVSDVVAAVKSVHPYDVPEIIALPVIDGLPAYLRWVVDETSR